MPFDASDPLPADLRQLRYVQHFCVWALRTSVACSPNCRILLREFDRAFAGQVNEGMVAYHALIQGLGHSKRQMLIGRPGHIDLTHDERSLLALLAAAQAEDRECCLAHARFLMGRDRLDRLYDDARRFTRLLRDQGHFFSKPRMETLQDAAFQASFSATG